MQVETYECEETRSEHVECTDEALKLIEELGLAGQKKLNIDGQPGQRFPYRKMTAEERTVYKEICPTVCRIDAYDAAPIPLRVLQVAAHANPLFDELEIWATKSADVKDPVLVGIRTLADAYKTKETYILARWGEALDEWPAMVKATVAKFRQRMSTQASTYRGYVAKYEAIATDTDISLQKIMDTY